MTDPDIFYAGVLDHMQGGVIALGMDGRVQTFNPAAEHILGVSAQHARGRLFAELFFENAQSDAVAQAVLDAIYDAEEPHNQDIAHQAGDRTIWLNLTASTLWSRPSAGEARRKVGIVVVFIDITERRAAEEALRRANDELERRVEQRTRELADANRALNLEIGERIRAQQQLVHLAGHDVLTGLPNRRLFEQRAATAIAGADAFALLYLDLDGFKSVNDTYGHGMGDRLLQLVARRLERCISESDTLARLGGDEFAIILRAAAGRDDARAVTERIIRHLSESYRASGGPDGNVLLRIGVSVGIALHPQAGRTLRDLILAADTAMYEAKRSGRGTWRMAPDRP